MGINVRVVAGLLVAWALVFIAAVILKIKVAIVLLPCIILLLLAYLIFCTFSLLFDRTNRWIVTKKEKRNDVE